ncbi:MAG: TIGR01777 family protein [Dehalococcoidia bacterium]|jgi:uncharacterized protein|nr:TIGR01777 family protein [Dehalococcoidia bacterium]
MKIAITGSSGMIGSALCLRLGAAGHEIVRIRNGDPSDAGAQWNPEAGWLREGVLDGVDAVLHLGGTSIDGGRWGAGHKESIRKSRIEGARLLVEAIRAMPEAERPKTFVTSSAVGFYGERGDERLTEASARGSGFLADVCAAWEAEALKAESLGLRVVAVRSGVVLRSLLPVVLTPFKLGLGGPLGSGKQYFAWVALDDVVRIYERVLVDDALSGVVLSGVVNGVAPQEQTNSEFTKALGAALHRPTVMPLPGFALKLIMGGEKASETALISQRVVPQALLDAGFEFTHPKIDSAIEAALAS